MRVLKLSLLALGVGVSLSAVAVPAPEPATPQPGVIVTANRLPEAVDDTLAAVSVITREDIEASATNDIVDLLRVVPGVDIVRGGGIGQQASVFLRGANSNHTLVLIDGVRVASLGTGAYAWEHLPVDQIERIEIVRGPRAAVWGADALGGVIQIFTRRNETLDGTLTVGNHDTYGANAGVGTRGERGGFGVRVGYLESRGTNATRPGNFSFDPDRDGFVQRSIGANGDVELGAYTLSANLLRSDDDVEFDAGETAVTQDTLALGLEGPLTDTWTHRVNLAGSREDLETPAFFSAYASRREQADWLHTLTLASNSSLLFGLSYLRERGENIDTFGGDPIYAARRTGRAGFATWHGRAGVLDFEASGRYDDSSVYGSESTVGGAIGWRVTDATRLSLSWNEGYRAPTFNELYSPGFGGLYGGNPLLDPESSRNLEAALDITLSPASRLALRAFRNDVDDLIDFSAPDTFNAINIKRARIDGAEAEWRWAANGWAVTGNATWQSPEDRDTGARLLRRPARKATALVERVFDGGARVGLEGYAASPRPDFGTSLPGYGTLALRGRLPLGAGLSLDGRIENLLDREYTVIDGYTTPGMTALLTLRWDGGAR
ncbi:TonB-dependent receptor domain-containing protein [Chiayiivirga flava]|uniref:Vitamin B12 transporter n=1 Tax=Chiayiivirga flava TaxID=659595 RepID=A0A7W8D498_9GAMM|nr:TonB-dependent receptor [Chiayiivirga flava]MBB5207634.1 vitamin B12 transporter [Chiayiivirga flava]